MIAVEAENNSPNPVRIATVYRDNHFRDFCACDMSLVRWLRISESLARKGYLVDMIINLEGDFPLESPNLRYISYAEVSWGRYHVIKSLFHLGFQSIIKAGAHTHPFIISKLGSVVGNDENTPGVYFYGEEYRELLEIQKHIAQNAEYVSILTKESERLWSRQYQTKNRILHVPTGVDHLLPRPDRNPYRHFEQKIAVYIGNIYTDDQQDINLLWQHRLNCLGKELFRYGIRLCLVGPGNTSQLDHEFVTYMSAVDQSKIWDYFFYADVGVALAQGEVQHNESSKIYYYLRTGLPVVSEAPIPNNWLIEEANLGYIAPFGNPEALAERIYAASSRHWDFEGAIQYMKEHHTWDHRASIYQRIIDSRIANSKMPQT